MTAAKCSDYGTDPTWDSTKRDLPHVIPAAMPTRQGTQRSAEFVTSCRECSNYVPGGVMLAASGWNAGHCRATGNLLLVDRLGSYAKDCSDRSFSSNPMREDDLTQARGLGITFLPEYMNGYGRPSAASLLAKSSINPQDYESDHPVSAGSASKGIRAWRSVSDPDGFGPDLKLPIFARDFWDDIQKSKVPLPGDDEHPEDFLDHAGFVYALTALWMELDETPVLWGPAGNGKTELFRHMSYLMGLPFERISISKSSEIDDLAGRAQYTPERGTYFQYGRIPKAWQKPNVICLDEPNAGPPEVWQFIRPLTDNSKQLVLDQNEGERIIRNGFCFMGMAMNPAWDPLNVGVETLADADGSRLMHIFMALPPEHVERAILLKVLQHDGWDDAAAKVAIDSVMSVASDLRQLSADRILPITWGLRLQIKVIRAMRFFSAVKAYRLGSADSLELVQQQAILDVVKSRIE